MKPQIAHRKEQISQWDFPPEGAFVHYEHVDTGLSKATCSFIFRDAKTNEVVTADCSDELKHQLKEMRP